MIGLSVGLVALMLTTGVVRVHRPALGGQPARTTGPGIHPLGPVVDLSPVVSHYGDGSPPPATGSGEPSLGPVATPSLTGGDR